MECPFPFRWRRQILNVEIKQQRPWQEPGKLISTPVAPAIMLLLFPGMYVMRSEIEFDWLGIVWLWRA
jgi:hypothetical protein